MTGVLARSGVHWRPGPVHRYRVLKAPSGAPAANRSSRRSPTRALKIHPHRRRAAVTTRLLLGCRPVGVRPARSVVDPSRRSSDGPHRRSGGHSRFDQLTRSEGILYAEVGW